MKNSQTETKKRIKNRLRDVKKLLHKICVSIYCACENLCMIRSHIKLLFTRNNLVFIFHLPFEISKDVVSMVTTVWSLFRLCFTFTTIASAIIVVVVVVVVAVVVVVIDNSTE